jgi:hypothetical protein
VPERPRTTPTSLALASLLLLGACSRDEVTHFKVPKSGAAPAGAQAQPPGMPPGMGGGQMPPGMQGDVPPPPAPEHGLAWTLPKGWKEERSGGMRYASLKAPVQGKADGSVVVLPGPAGGELSNVNRWRGQIGLGPIDDAALAAARKIVATKAGKVSVYDFTSEGHQKSRLVAGLLEAGGSTWFVKLTGDEAAVTAARPDFMKLLESLRLD